MRPLTSCETLDAIRWSPQLGEWDRISISVSLSLSLLLLFLYSLSEAPSSVSLCLFRVCSPPCARSSVLRDFYVFSVMGGMKSAKHLSAGNFPACYELNSPWFFIHESERHAFFTCHVGVWRGGRRGEVGGCVIAPVPLECIRLSRQWKTRSQVIKKRKKEKNGSGIQTWSLIKQWINVNIWRHAIDRITWPAKPGGMEGAVRCWKMTDASPLQKVCLSKTSKRRLIDLPAYC